MTFIIHRLSFIVLLLACTIAFAFLPRCARSCPFCVAVKPTLAQQCEAAEVAFLGECLASPTAANGKHEFAVRRVLSGQSELNGKTAVAAPLAEGVRLGTLALVLGEGDADDSLDKLRWRCVPLTEIGFAYVGGSPDRRTPGSKRLPYFARFLEHVDPLVAEDAYLEFGHAPFDVVAEVAPSLDAAKLRQWIVDPAVPPERKGFYGLVLGLTARANQRVANVALLRGLIETDTGMGGDFRAGFDGILGGYLAAEGPAAIELLAKRFLKNEDAAVGDVRHVQRALRFYHEFGPAKHRPAVEDAVVHLLDNPATAAGAITDLARWQRWSQVDRVAALYDRKDFAQSDIRRAIVGYLRVCPSPSAQRALDELRRRDPKTIATAEGELETLTGTK